MYFGQKYISIKNLLIIGFIVVVIPILFGLISNYINSGYITVNIKNSDSYSLILSKNNQDPITIDNYDNNSKIRIRSGAYTLKAISNNAEETFITSVKIPKFLKTVNTEGELAGLSGLDFIANNPDSCAAKNSKTVYSFSCGDFYSEVLNHAPATDKTPPYVLDEKTYQSWQQIFNIGDQTYGLIEELDIGYSIVDFPDNNSVYRSLDFASGTVDINDKEASLDQLSVKRFKEGFVVYKINNINEAYYLSSVDAKPQKLSFEPLNIFEESRLGLTISNDFLTYYEIPEYLESIPVHTKTLSVRFKDNTSKLIKLKTDAHTAYYCGENLICAQREDSFVTYLVEDDIAEDIVNEINGINESYNVNNKNYLVTNSGEIIEYDPLSNTGSTVYRNTSNSYCGFYNIDNKLGFCVQFEGSIQNVLTVLSDNTKGINAINSLNNLSSLDYVSSVNINNRYIWVSLDIPLSQNQVTGIYERDPVLYKRTTDTIKGSLDNNGVDLNYYKLKII